MSPNLTSHDVANQPCGDGKSLRQNWLIVGSRGVKLSNLRDLIFGELGHRAVRAHSSEHSVLRTGVRCCSAFLDHVLHVLFVGSKKEMSRVAALSIIALVTDAKSFRDLPMSKLPCNSMGSSGALIEANLSITIGLDVVCPLPAIHYVHNSNLGPKPWRECDLEKAMLELNSGSALIGHLFHSQA